MIVGLTGPTQGGKETVAKFLEENCDFSRVSLKRLPPEVQAALHSTQDGPQEETSAASTSSEESKETDENSLDLISRVEWIKRVITKLLEIDWQRNWVVYPIPLTPEM